MIRALISCMSSRAIHVDLDGYLQLLRRYASVRGWPKIIHSDNGSKLVGASQELKYCVSNIDWEEIKTFSHPYGTQWNFSPSDAPWCNCCAEALIKSVKRVLSTAVGDKVLSFVELQTCLFETAQLVNQRPIGISHAEPNQGTYLLPND